MGCVAEFFTPVPVSDLRTWGVLHISGAMDLIANMQTAESEGVGGNPSGPCWRVR